MSRWHIASLGATEVYLHPGMLLYALYALLIGHGWFMLLAILSILLHEAAHAMTAAAFSRPPSSLELTPLGAVMRLDDEGGLSPVKQGLVLLAGPGMTLLLAYAAVWLTRIELLPLRIGHMLFVSNVSILLLNLLPVLPLDGGRLLGVLLRAFFSVRTVNRIMRCLGGITGIGLIAGNIYVSWRMGGWNLSLAFAGCCILYSVYTATMSQAMAELRYFMDRRIHLERKGRMELRTICALHTTPIRKLVRVLPQGRMVEFVCIETGSMNVMGRMIESQIIQLYLNKPEITLAEAVHLLKTECSSAKLTTN